jgi:secreted PhoX family phosphatase
MLQTLVVSSEPGIDLTEAVNVGATWNTEWVTIDDPDPPFDPTREQAESGGMLPPVAAQGFEQGAAVFRRLEGCCTEDGVVWFTSTNGGRGHGQVWRYSPRDIDGGELTLAFVSPAESVLSGPDNLCVSPAGSIVMCEDTEREPNRVVALTTTGLIVPLVENIGDDEEFAGVTFSPDGETMFVNVMGDRDDGLLGRTFAVWGPWHLGPV